MTFLATHPIPAANLVKVAESVNVFTSLLWNILFAKQKKKSNYWFYSHRNYGLCVLQCFTSLCWFWFITERYPFFSSIVQSSQWESDNCHWNNLSEGVRRAALAIAMYLPCFRLSPPAIIPNSLFTMKLSFKSIRSFSSSTWRKWTNALYKSWRNVSIIASQVFEDNEASYLLK